MDVVGTTSFERNHISSEQRTSLEFILVIEFENTFPMTRPVKVMEYFSK